MTADVQALIARLQLYASCGHASTAYAVIDGMSLARDAADALTAATLLTPTWDDWQCVTAHAPIRYRTKDYAACPLCAALQARDTLAAQIWEQAIADVTVGWKLHGHPAETKFRDALRAVFETRAAALRPPTVDAPMIRATLRLPDGDL